MKNLSLKTCSSLLCLTAGWVLCLAAVSHAQNAPPPTPQVQAAILQVVAGQAAQPQTAQQQAADWKQQGDKAEAANDLAVAVEDYRKAVQLDPAQLNYVVSLIQCYAGTFLLQNKKIMAAASKTPQGAQVSAQLATIRFPTSDQLPDIGIALQELVEQKMRVFTAPDAQTRLKGGLTAAAAILAAEGDEAIDRSDYNKATDLYNRALATSQRSGATEQQVSALNGLGNVYDDLGQHERAVLTYQAQLKLQQQINAGPADRAMTLNNIGWALDGGGKSEQALDFYNQALAIERTLPTNDVAESLGMGRASLESYTIGNVGLSYYRLNQPQKGIEYGEQALILMRQVKNQVGEGKVLSWLGWGYSHMGQSVKALQALEQSLTVNHADGNVASEAFTLSTLMSTWKELHKPKLAIFYGKQAVNAYQAVRRKAQRLDKDLQKSFLQSHEETYRELADLLIGEGRLPEAQQVLGLLKQEELFDFVRRDAKAVSAAEGTANLTSEEAQQEARYHEIADHITQIGARRGELLDKDTRTPDEEAELTKLEADLEVANRQFQSFLDGLSTKFGTTAQKGRVDQITDAQSLQQTLRDIGKGTVALYTLVGDDKYRIILVTADTEVAAEYPITAADLNHKVLAYRQTLQNPSLDPRPQGQELYKILVAPIAKALDGAGAQTLMWSLDGSLRYLPVSALYDGKQYLVERYRSAIFTPASNANLKDVPTAHWKGLGLGVSKPQPGFDALPGVATELNGIITSAPGATGTTPVKTPADEIGVLPGAIEMDEAFTAVAMKQALRQHYPLIHIASHFAFQPGNETDSFLLLGDGTHFTIDQIKTLSFRDVDLLTLSACDTATGGVDADGREVESFGVLAQRQGARAVMATLWPVADKSTQELMREFYRLREAQAGTSKAEALRQAQLALLHGTVQADSGDTTRGARLARGGNAAIGAPLFTPDPKAPFAHPYFWAPFILIGNWR